MGKVIIYEGLFGILIGSHMTRAFKKALPSVSCETRSWLSRKPTGPDDILIGHSFGAKKAFDMAFENGCHALIMVDIRGLDSSNNDKRFFTSKGRVNFAVNFYQMGFMRGYKVKNINNIYLSGVSHMTAPYHEKVADFIKKWVTI